MTRIGLVPSEPLRPAMAGIGIRYLEMARRLPRAGVDVVLTTPGPLDQVPETGLDASALRPFRRGHLAETLADCDVVVAQGQLANDVVLELESTPVVVDLYDPFLVENFAYLSSLGLDPWRNDHATWVLQMSRGDFFLCSCDEQRQFYLGFLTALGRVNPRRAAQDPDLRGLIDLVPFGVPAALPEHRPYLEPVAAGTRRILFGGLYDWYDPWPVLEALESADEPSWTLLFIRNPNQGTPQDLFGRVEGWCRERGLWGERVQAIDWVPSARRFDLLRDVDLVVSTHRPTLETRLSLRTRFLEALAAGCPVVVTEGGAISRLLEAHGAGRTVPPADPRAVETALRELLSPSFDRDADRRAARRLLESFTWDRALEPLLAFCRAPRRDRWKGEFGFRPSTHAPPDALGFRARRRLRRLGEQVRRRLASRVP